MEHPHARRRCQSLAGSGSATRRAVWLRSAIVLALLGPFHSRVLAADKPATTQVTVSPDSVSYAERSKIRDFSIHVHLSHAPTTAPTVQFTLDTGRGDPRHFAAIPDPDAPSEVFKVSTPLIPEYLHPQRLRIVANFPNGSVTCTVQDTELEIGKRTVMLSQIRRAQGGNTIKLTLDTGETVTASATSLPNLRGDLGPVTVTLNLAKSDSFSVTPMHPSLASVAYKVEVRESDHVVAERSGEISVNKTADDHVPATAP